MFGSMVSRLGDRISDTYYSALADVTSFLLKRDLEIDRHTAGVRDLFVKAGEGISDIYYSALAEVTIFFLKRYDQTKFNRLFSKGPSNINKPNGPAISGFTPPHNSQTGQSVGGLVSTPVPNTQPHMDQPLARAAPAIGAQVYTGGIPICQTMPMLRTPPTITCCHF